MSLKPLSQSEATKPLEIYLSLTAIQSMAVRCLPWKCFFLPTERWGSPMTFLTHLTPLLQLEFGISEVPRALQMLSPQGT